MQNYEKKIRKLATLENTELFVCNDGVKLAELMVSDRGMIISLFDSNGRFYYEYMSCSEPEAIIWAKELIEFYKSRAWQIENEQCIDNLIGTAESEAFPESMMFSLH
ncbi:transcriptional regulator FilR1 domain-containing protein [Methanosarcina barkeri]|nr:transcriptional regulator FilR1 domain-containing protein [Methanosarcina barkeri]